MKGSPGSYEEKINSLLSKKGNLCISAIIPTHSFSPERSSDPLQVVGAIEQVRLYLRKNYPDMDNDSLLTSLSDLYREIDFNHHTSGFGLYVSDGLKMLIRFFFPVKQKLVVSDSFDLRDLLYQAYYARPYYVLQLEEKGARLYRGELGVLEQISDEHFPKEYTEEYEYSHPSRGSSYVGHAFVKEFERDKSQMEAIRFSQFARQVDSMLNQYLERDTLLVIAATERDLAYFRKETAHAGKIAGEVPGNYSRVRIASLEDLTWRVVKTHLNKKKLELFDDFREKIGQGRAITGLPGIWKAAAEGRGFILLVEKDYAARGFLSDTDFPDVHLIPPATPHRMITDVVNTIMETMLERNGKVILVENYSLESYQHMALITRY